MNSAMRGYAANNDLIVRVTALIFYKISEDSRNVMYTQLPCFRVMIRMPKYINISYRS